MLVVIFLFNLINLSFKAKSLDWEECLKAEFEYSEERLSYQSLKKSTEPTRSVDWTAFKDHKKQKHTDSKIKG